MKDGNIDKISWVNLIIILVIIIAFSWVCLDINHTVKINKSSIKELSTKLDSINVKTTQSIKIQKDSANIIINF